MIGLGRQGTVYLNQPDCNCGIYSNLLKSSTERALAATGLILSASPLLWIIPVTFVATFTHHTTMLTVARVEPHGSERLFSRSRIICGFMIAVSWTLSYKMHVGIWLMVSCAALAFVEAVLSWIVAIFNQKERKRITYAAKWRPLNVDRSWSISR
ncbi:hypothetical protein F5050DRAFT_118092 [Lentinula boryana]|uniref:Uncharacterized protein n=1 Tax=Lentinula boryana TaxID=40481 RepID=A0ABQ8QD24_9AGAR|nr:hypothetical protein F5050DRAFT_118092 [Lentinula boryana]